LRSTRFLDFTDDTSSLVMALLAFAAIASYSVVMFLLAGSPHRDEWAAITVNVADNLWDRNTPTLEPSSRRR
jgi:hypothetical protein